MHSRHTVRYALALIALALCLGAVATAQEFVILHAAYGNARRHINVTQRLRQLAAADVKFQLTWRTFGDPAEGQAKWLRIYARGPRGGNRIFEYADNSWIDGAMFSGWGGGNWGRGPWKHGWNPPGWSVGAPGTGPGPGAGPGPGPGGPGGGNVGRLQILSARYGAGKQQTDVTNRLQSLVANGRLSIRVNNGSMAVADPAPGSSKSVFVSYSVGNGKRQTRTAAEGSYLTLP